MLTGPPILGWFDPDPKKAVSVKIAEGVERYAAKFELQPTVCWVNANDAAVLVEGVQTVVASYVRPHNYWIGAPPTTPSTAAQERTHASSPALEQAREIRLRPRRPAIARR